MKILALSQDNCRQWVDIAFFLKGKWRPCIMRWEGKYPCCPISFKENC